MELRPYQEEARKAVETEWREGKKRTLLVLPTGTGKTIVFASIAQDMVSENKRVLILAHRGELLEQAADKLKKATGLSVALEKASSSCLDGLNSLYRVVVGSVQTLMRQKRLDKFDKDYFNVIIIDEAHHAISTSYQNILQYFDNADVLGVTATPDRADMKDLGSYFDTLAYEYSLPQAIKSGYLVPIKAQTIPLQLDISQVSLSAGDFKASEVSTALDPYLMQIAHEMQQYCKGRKTVVFLPLVATSQKFCEYLNETGFRAAEVNGNSDDRKEVLDDFAKGRYNVLCNSMLLTEGWDCPSVDCIVVLRPTKSRALYCQMVGRGTRLYPGKKELLLLDFLWLTDRHELCRPAHLLAKSENVAKAMTRKIEDAIVPLDLEEVETTATEEVIEAREEALQKELAAQRKKKAKLVDPLQYVYSIQAEDLTDYQPAFGWEIEPPTDAQKTKLEKFGIFPDTIQTAGEAAQILGRCIKRAEAGLSTAKQIRLLERKGFQHVGQWTFKEASNMIARISANGWRVPYRVDPHTYKPGETA